MSEQVVPAPLGRGFTGVIFLLREVLGAEGPFGVAVSTLAAAAVFNPLRKRVQNGSIAGSTDPAMTRREWPTASPGVCVTKPMPTGSSRGWLDVLAEAMQPTGVGV